MVILTIIDMAMGNVPILGSLWSFVNFFINILVIPPLTTLWWVRLYMSGTGKTIYFNDLLAHPNDLAVTIKKD